MSGQRRTHAGRSRVRLAVALAVLAAAALPAVPAQAEQASSQDRRLQAGFLDTGDIHTCAVLRTRQVLCWGLGVYGALGYGNQRDVGNGDAPSTAGPVDVGQGRTVTAMAAGDNHTCALLDTGQVRCWGDNQMGQLGYGHKDFIGNDETPATAGPVDLGPGRTATAITAGYEHTCAVLDTGRVRCWGSGAQGALGYGGTANIGDDELPTAVGTVNLGTGRTATAISAGLFHTCAVLDTGQVRCWGDGTYGALGYGNTADIGDNESPFLAGPVKLGPGRTAVAIGAGEIHTCALLDTGQVRCWGTNDNGELGLGHTTTIGDNETPDTTGPVDLGPGRTATAISAGHEHNCALLDGGQVRCWGENVDGKLGYPSADQNVGDDEKPDAYGPVDMGATATAVSAGGRHTCVMLVTDHVRCWGLGAHGSLGYGNTTTIGDDETPASAGPVSLGGTVFGRIADLSLALAAPPSVTAGEPFAATLTIRNDGPDGTTGVEVTAPAPPDTTVAAATPSQGIYNATTGEWQVGDLASGATATLTLSLRASSAGDRAFYAELVGSGVGDYDSEPANGVTTEDDRAAATTTVTAVTTPPPPPPPTPPTASLLSGKLTLSAKPRRGDRRVKVRGKLALPASTPAAACAGKVTLTLKRGKRRLARRTAMLRPPKTGSTCTFATTLKLKKRLRTGQKLRLTGSLAATSLLAATATSAKRTVRR